MVRRGFLSSNGLIATILLMTVFACGFGALLFGKVGDLSPAVQERQRLEAQEWKERAEAERGAYVFWAWALRVALALTLVGAVLVAITYGLRRASEIRPDSAGLFPVVRVKVGKALLLHDPNRSVTPITLYAPAAFASQISVVSVPSSGAEAQERTTARAQVVQLAAAVHRHPPPLAGRQAGQSKGADMLPAGDDQAQVWTWPSRVPLKALIEKRTSSKIMCLTAK